MGPSLWVQGSQKLITVTACPIVFSHLIAVSLQRNQTVWCSRFSKARVNYQTSRPCAESKRMSWYNRFCSSALGSTNVKFDAWPGPQFYSSFRSLESTNEETIMFFLKRSNHSMTLSPSQTVHLTTTPTHHHRHSQPTYDVSPVSLKANIKKPNWTGDGRQYHLLVPQQLILPTVLSGLLLMSTPIGRKVIPWKTKQ